MQDATGLFKTHFGRTPAHRVQAGRLEVLGNHTDYNHGLVMSVAVDKYVFIASSPRNDGRIELVSSAFSAPEKFSISDLQPNPAATWANYVKGVLVQLRKRGVHFGGFNAAIHSTIPMERRHEQFRRVGSRHRPDAAPAASFLADKHRHHHAATTGRQGDIAARRSGGTNELRETVPRR